MTLRTLLHGQKTYLTAAAALITALIAYGDGAITTPELIAAIFAALQSVFLRLGLERAVETLVTQIVQRSPDA